MVSILWKVDRRPQYPPEPAGAWLASALGWPPCPSWLGSSLPPWEGTHQAPALHSRNYSGSLWLPEGEGAP